MKLYEFQAKELLTRLGVAIPTGRLAATPAEAERIARRLGFRKFAVKAQVVAGDRAAHGGVAFAETPEDVARLSEGLIGRRLVTSQTARGGDVVRWVYIEEAIDLVAQLYMAAVVDPVRGRHMLFASADGGDDVERRVRDAPERMRRLTVPVSQPIDAANFRSLADDLVRARALDIGPSASLAQDLAHIAATLVAGARQLDATLLEINPLGIDRAGRLIALDSKMVIDENALFRQRELMMLRALETTETGDPTELAAEQHQINYMRLDGDVGVVVNGAGLALATLDTLADAGGSAANFMDIRTTATSQDIAYGFRLIVANPGTRAVLVNIHGGGMQRCDTIAEGLAIALRGSNRKLPMVVRFAGNNAGFGLTRLAGAGVAFEAATDMRDAAERAVRLAALEAA